MTNQRNPQPEYEDLTRFADENFDSDEVDLFQFSGNSETSPLTKLKSVILSLEWEITDEYLQELAEELAALTPSLQDDKVAKLYLQGMGKIGKYLRLRGAHAHANAIKLLLRYFYDFESILNSPDMDNERINKVVQNDVRMFKVLQYQIKLAEETPEEGEGQPGMATGVVRDTGKAGNALRLFKAAILELDWEVSNESLERFSDALKALSEEEIQNKSALILIQGMQALGEYISEERAHAHPEVFNLLHAFHDGLERILDTGPAALDQKQKKRILVDRINRLNHLKKLIAPQDAEVPEAVSMAQAVAAAQARGPAAPAAEEAPAPVVEAETPAPEAPAAPADEEPALFDEPTPALADTEAPAAPAAAIPGVYTDDYDDDDVDPRFGGSVTPALSDVTPALADADAPAASAEDESALFDDDVPLVLFDAPASTAPAAAVPGVYTDDYDDDDVDPRFGGSVTPALSDVTPALSDAEPGPAAAFAETEMETKEPPATGDSIAAEIDDLFAPSANRPVGGPVAVAPAAPIAGASDDDDDDELDLFPPTSSMDDLPSALSDADVPHEELELGAEDAELSAKLDSFFDFPGEPAPAAPESPSAPAAEPEEALSLEPGLFAEEPASPATPADVTLVFEEEPAAAEAEDEDSLLFIDVPASTQPDLLVEIPADDGFLFGETPVVPAARAAETPADGPVAALADADELGEENLILEADEELTAQLDDFFSQMPGEPAPVPAAELAPSPADAAPADDMLLFEGEPIAHVAESAETLTLDGDIFGDAPAAAAQDDMPSALEDAEMPSALADAEPEEETTFEADEELSAHLDNFFDIPGEPAAAAPADEPAPAFADAAPADDMLLFEEEPATQDDAALLADEPAPALAEENPAEEPGLFLDESDLGIETAKTPKGGEMLFADDPAPAFAAEGPAEEPSLFLDESDLAVEEGAGEGMLFVDAPMDESPAMPIPEEELEAAQPKVFDEVVEALAGVEPARGEKAAHDVAEADAGFQDQLDSFFDEPQATEPAPPPEEEYLSVQEETPETPAEPAEEAAFAVSEETVGDETLLFAEAEAEPTEPVGDETLLFAEEGAEEKASGMLTLDDNLVTPEETEATPGPAEVEATELRLEHTAAPVEFDDLVTPDELRDIMSHEGDIEDIADEELALEEDEPAPEPVPEEPPLEAALNGDFDEPTSAAPLFGAEEKDTLAVMDDLFGVQDDGPAVERPAPTEEMTVSVEDVVADESVLFAAEAGEVAAPAAEPGAHFAEAADASAFAVAPATGMVPLSERLPALIAGYTADQLNDCRQWIKNLRQDGGLSPVQSAAAGMLDSVLTGMPKASAQLDAATASLLEGLYAALAEPQPQLPIETVTAYSAWVQSHVTGKQRVQPVPDSEARELFRELSEFRSRMEQELAQLREELKKR